MTSLKQLFGGGARQFGMVFALIALVIIFQIATGGKVLTPTNAQNIINGNSYVLILAIGMVLVIIAGHIDLSVGSVAAVVGIIVALAIRDWGIPWWAGILLGLAVGAVIGAWQGFWVAYVGIPAFIVTLAGMLLFRGLTFIVLSNVSLSPFGGTYYAIANGFFNGLLGGYGVDVFTLVIFAIGVVGYAVWQVRGRRSKISHQQSVEALPWFILKIVAIAAVVMWFGYQLSTSRGLPFVLILLAVLIIAYSVITQKSVFGRHVYAIGGNLHAALLSGVNVRRVNFWIFVNMGLLAGIAGVVFSSRTNGAQPGAGNMFELDAIAACFIGGAAVTGGVGRVGGAIVGGLIMAVMSNGMQLMGLDQATQQVVKGLVLLIAVAFDVWNKRRTGAAR